MVFGLYETDSKKIFKLMLFLLFLMKEMATAATKIKNVIICRIMLLRQHTPPPFMITIKKSEK